LARIRIVEEAPIGATPALVYGLIADYRQHHPRFLPPAFSDLTVEQGGVGAGTVFTYTFKLAGRTMHPRTAVTEPEPGRVLVESDGRVTTRFIVDPEAQHTRVRFETEYESPGPQGLIESLLVPPMLRKLYRDELRRLDKYARQVASTA
jgi:hypothetical protein